MVFTAISLIMLWARCLLTDPFPVVPIERLEGVRELFPIPHTLSNSELRPVADDASRSVGFKTGRDRVFGTFALETNQDMTGCAGTYSRSTTSGCTKRSCW